MYWRTWVTICAPRLLDGFIGRLKYVGFAWVELTRNPFDHVITGTHCHRTFKSLDSQLTGVWCEMYFSKTESFDFNQRLLGFCPLNSFDHHWLFSVPI